MEKLTVNETFKCEICGNTYKQMGYLNSHMNKKHVKQNNFTCDICNLSFDTDRKLSRHTKTEHCFNCPDCKKEFTSKELRDDHFLSHLKCDICSKSFDKKWKLTKHNKSHI